MHVLDFYILQTYSMSLFIFLKHEPATIVSDDEQMIYSLCSHGNLHYTDTLGICGEKIRKAEIREKFLAVGKHNQLHSDLLQILQR